MREISEIDRNIDRVEAEMTVLRAKLNGLSREFMALKTEKLMAEAWRDGRVAA